MEGERTSADGPVGERPLSVRDVMTREFLGVNESDPVSGTADLLLADDTDVAVILRGSDPIGIVTPADALAHLTRGGTGEDPVRAAMREPPPTVSPDEDAFEAAGAMADEAADCLLVDDGDGIVGVVTQRDVVGATASVVNRRGRGRPPTSDDVSEEVVDRRAEPSREDDDYSRQSVCEACGALTPSLQDFNGQLVCADCRDV